MDSSVESRNPFKKFPQSWRNANKAEYVSNTYMNTNHRKKTCIFEHF